MEEHFLQEPYQQTSARRALQHVAARVASSNFQATHLRAAHWFSLTVETQHLPSLLSAPFFLMTSSGVAMFLAAQSSIHVARASSREIHLELFVFFALERTER